MVGKCVNSPSLKLINNGVESFLNKHEHIVFPGALGAMGGWLTGVDPKLGFLQGVVGGSLCTWVLWPIAKCIQKDSRTGAEKIHENVKKMFYVSSIVADTAVPILLTMYLSDPALKAVASLLPSSITWLVAPAVVKEYTFFHGLIVTFYAEVTKLSVGAIRNYHPRNDHKKT